MFKTLGAKVFDADKVVHDLLKSDAACIRRVKQVFKNVIDQKGKIDRAALGAHVFKNRARLKRLENIVHPLVGKRLKSFLTKHKNARCIVLDVPLLFEGRLHKLTDINVVVKANQALQIKRIVRRMGISKAEALRRIRAQMPMHQKIKLADEVIDNRGTQKQMKSQVKKIYDKYI